jgi:hypothetical protein
MISKLFIVKKSDFLKKKLTIIQHKLRVVMKCYTIREFEADEQNKTYSFKVVRRINGVKIESKKELQGSYEIDEVDEDRISLRLKVGSSN